MGKGRPSAGRGPGKARPHAKAAARTGSGKGGSPRRGSGKRKAEADFYSSPPPFFAEPFEKECRPDASSLSDEDAALAALLGDTLRQANRPLGMDELLRIVKLPRRTKKRLEYVLYHMQEQGLALKGSTGWSSPARLRFVEGTLSVQRAGMGFVSVQGKKGQDVFIPPSALNGAWHGDRVRALVLPGRRGPSPEGRIVAVLERADREIAVAALKRQSDGAWMCAPADQRIQALFVAAVSDLDREVSERDLLLLKPGERIGPNLWRARATVNLEREESPAAQERLVKSKHGVPSHFPAAALDEARSFPLLPAEDDFAGRRRLENLCFVTIDGRRARDFDDAIQVERHRAGFRLRVAIADVSHYIAQASALDDEARLRGNSYYFPLSVEPMLPEALSNGLCSLRPGEPRLAMTADMLFSEQGKKLSAEFYPAVIVSHARLTYGQIERGLLLGDEEELRLLGPALPMLREAEALARLLAEARRKRGSLDFDLPEAEVVFNEQGEVQGLVPRNRHFGHRMIEEFMIAANESAAEFLRDSGEGFLYRVHQAPDPEKLASLVKYIEQSGLGSGIALLKGARRKKGAVPSVEELAALLEGVRGKAEQYSVNRLLLRSMMQARYEPDNAGHYGLGSDCYCHFTSPIRRYADLTVHRALKRALRFAGRLGNEESDGAPIKPYTRSGLTAIAEHINECERLAAEAEREIHKRLAILLLKDRIGERFEGIVSGLADFGIFIELPAVMVEGMAPLSSLTDDFYRYLPEKQELLGVGTGRVFRLGQEASVTLVDASLARLEVTLEIVSTKKSGRKTSKNSHHSRK